MNAGCFEKLELLHLSSSAVIVLAAAPGRLPQPTSADDTARFLAGMPPSSGSPLAPLTQDPAWQQHARYFNSAFGTVDKNQFAKIRAWSARSLRRRSQVLFYLFSGPDFLYANAFFPNATTYVMAGLEPAGPIPDLLRLPRGSVGEALRHIESSLSTILTISFFKTHDMRMTLGANRLSGTLPIALRFPRAHRQDDPGSLADQTRRAGHAAAGKRAVQSRNAAIRRMASKSCSRRRTPASGRSTISVRTSRTTASKQAALRNSAIAWGPATHLSRAPLICSIAMAFPTSAISCCSMRCKFCRMTPAFRSAISRRINGSCGRLAATPGRSRCLPATISPKLTQLFQKGRTEPLDFGLGYQWRVFGLQSCCSPPDWRRRSRRPKRSQARVPTLRQPTVPIRLAAKKAASKSKSQKSRTAAPRPAPF